MKKLLQPPKFFIDRVQLIFALILVCIVFIIVFLIIEQQPSPQSPVVNPTHSKNQITQQVTPSGSLGPINVQPNSAVARVENLQEVQAAKSISTANNTQFVTEIDSYPTSQNYYYVVHAFEVVSDGNGHTHTATVGWYRINPQTGQVTNATDL